MVIKPITPPVDLKIESLWHDGDGRVPYHFANFPAGNRCGWSCEWYVFSPQGTSDLLRLGPKDWKNLSPETMSSEALLCEIEDIAARMMQLNIEPNAVVLMEEYLKPSEEAWRLYATKIISTARGLYKSYLCNWNPPSLRNFEMRPKLRPGFEHFKPIEQMPFVETIIRESTGRLLETPVAPGTPAKERKYG